MKVDIVKLRPNNRPELPLDLMYTSLLKRYKKEPLMFSPEGIESANIQTVTLNSFDPPSSIDCAVCDLYKKETNEDHQLELGKFITEMYEDEYSYVNNVVMFLSDDETEFGILGY